MLNIKAELMHKPDNFYLTKCVIEKIIELPDDVFDKLVSKPYESHDFIGENRSRMWMGLDAYHCLVVLGENRNDAVLIESEGYDYPRKAAFFSGGRTIIERELEMAAEHIIKNAAPDFKTRSWEIRYEDIQKLTGLKVSDDNGVGGMLAEALCRRPEIAEVDIGEYDFEITCRPEFYNSLAGLPSLAEPGSSRVGTPVTGAVTDLRDIIRENMIAFERDWLTKDAIWLIANAEQIAATKQAYSDIFAYASEEEMEYLLRFKNALEVVRDAFDHDFSREGDLCTAISYIMDKRDAESDYELVDGYSNQATREMEFQ